MDTITGTRMTMLMSINIKKSTNTSIMMKNTNTSTMMKKKYTSTNIMMKTKNTIAITIIKMKKRLKT
jgi:hypothetical protein